MKNKVSIKRLNLLISKRCNLHCRMCDYRLGSLFTKELTIDQIKDLIHDAVDLGLEQLELSGGEPMLYKDIYKVIEYGKSFGLKIMMMTNGVLIGEDEVEKLVFSGLQGVVISLEGFEEINDKIRGLGNYEKAINAIKGFQKQKKHMDFIKVGITISQYNYRQLFSFTKYLFEKLGISCFSYNPFNKEMLHKANFLKREEEFIIPPDSLSELEEEIEKIIDYSKSVNLDIPNTNFLRKIPNYFTNEVVVPERGCTVPLNGCSVDASGKVYACWGEPVVTGDLTETSLQNIINSAKYQTQCERALKRLCRGCLTACYTDIH